MAIPIHASGSDEQFQYLIFGKDDGLMEFLRELLLILDVSEQEILNMTVRNGGTITDALEGRQMPMLRDVYDIIDEHYWFFRPEFHLSVVFGQDLVFVTGHFTPATREKVMKLVDERCEFVK